MIRRTVRALLVALLVSGGMAYAQVPDLSTMDIVLRAVPDGPVASVNGVLVDKGEFTALYRNESELAIRRAGAATPTDLDRIRLGMSCVMMLVQRELLIQEATRRNINISDADVEKAWSEELKRLQESLADKTGKQLSEDEILKQAGASREQAKADLARALRIERVRAEIVKESGVKVADADVTTFLNENKSMSAQPEMLHMKQIYFKVEQAGGKRDEARYTAAMKRAQDSLSRIQAGQKFETVAKAVSEGKFKEQGGDFGPMPVNQIPPFLVEAAKNLKPGEVSGIIESDFGIHIIMMVGSVPGKQISTDELRPKIENYLLAQKGEDAIKEHCRKMMEASRGNVKVFLNFDKELAVRPDLQKALQ